MLCKGAVTGSQATKEKKEHLYCGDLSINIIELRIAYL